MCSSSRSLRIFRSDATAALTFSSTSVMASCISWLGLAKPERLQAQDAGRKAAASARRAAAGPARAEVCGWSQPQSALPRKSGPSRPPMQTYGCRAPRERVERTDPVGTGGRSGGSWFTVSGEPSFHAYYFVVRQPDIEGDYAMFCPQQFTR